MRITNKMLETQIDYLNEITNSPKTSYTKNKDGKIKANIGNYHLYGAYGGVNVHRMVNDGGGVQTPLGGGCVPKRELYNKLRAFISGIEYAKKEICA